MTPYVITGTLTLTEPPEHEPITLAQAYAHLRVDVTSDEDDMLIGLAISAARRAAEHRLGHGLVTRTYTLDLSAFPSGKIDLRLRRVASIASVTYTDTEGDPQTLDSSLYAIAPGDSTTYLKPTEPWPGGTGVAIQIVQGFGAAEDVPAEIRSWMLLHIGTSYRNRESLITGVTVSALPDRHLDSLLDPEREYTIA